MLFWCAGLYFSQRAIFARGGGAGLGMGLTFGLGLLSKHTMALFAPCLALGIYLAQRPNDPTTQRPRVNWTGSIAALLLGLLIFVPNLFWQSRHGWMTFQHLFLLTGAGAGQNPGRRLGEYIGSQAGLITPLLFLAMIWALIQAWRSDDARQRFVSTFSLPI